jgi:hypothetical protein
MGPPRRPAMHGRRTPIASHLVHKDQDPKVAEAVRAINPLGALQGQKGTDKQDKYVINIKQIVKFVVGLGDRVTLTDIKEGMLREVVETPSFCVCLDRFIRYYYTDSALYSLSDLSTLVSTLQRVFYSIVL